MAASAESAGRRERPVATDRRTAMTIFRIDADALARVVKKRTTQQLLKDLGALIRGLEPRLKASVMKARKMHDAVAAALKTPDPDTLQLLSRGCQGELAQFEKHRKDLESMGDLLKQIQKDEEFVADHLDKLLPATKGLANEKVDCEGWIGQIEADQKRVDEALKSATANQAGLEKKVVELQKKADGFRTVLKDNLKNQKDKADRALAAAKARDAKGFADAAGTVEQLASKAIYDFMTRSIDTSLAELRKQFGPRVDALPVVKDLNAVRAEAGKTAQQAARVLEQVKAAEPKGVDARRAAKVLSLEKYESELAKVLDGPPSGHEKGLEAIAKKAGQKSTGKMLLAMLVKARVL